MVQTKKFQNTFLNEYLAIQLHERDVEERAKQQGAIAKALSTAAILKQSNVDIELIAKSTGLSTAQIAAL